MELKIKTETESESGNNQLLVSACGKCCIGVVFFKHTGLNYMAVELSELSDSMLSLIKPPCGRAEVFN